MKILHINKFLYRRGGAESYMFDVAGLQTRRGHTVEFWGMEHPENGSLRFEKHFVTEADFGEHEASVGEQVRLISRMVWSNDAKKGLSRVLEDFQPDVIHCHNIYHQLSPSIFRAASQAGVPVVLTMHDYKLVCPSYQLLAKGEVCERCVNGGAYNAIVQRCSKDSLGASAAVAIESTIHRATNAYKNVGAFIAPSKFMADVVTKSGRYTQPIKHIPHFTELDRQQATPGTSDYVLFAGRLASEKGLDVLLDAAEMLAERGVKANVAIAGGGPDDARLRERAKDATNVEFHGLQDKSGVDALLASAAAVLVPSTWHENQPMIILEAIAAGLPVIASSIGGISELIDDGVSGTLVPPGDATALADAIENMLSDSERRNEMGQAARALAMRDFDAETHLDALEATYDAAEREMAR